MNDSYFSPIYGLVTKHDPTTENGGLFLLYYLVLKNILGIPITTKDRFIYVYKMDKAKVEEGLYLRSANHTTRTVSQDEQTGFSGTSYLIGLTYHLNIWKYLTKHYGNYPVTGENKFYNGGSYYTWAVLAKSKLSILFAWWFTINLLISSNKPENDTSSKLMYFAELHIMKDISIYSKLLHKYFIWRMNKMYGDKWVASLFNIYFHTEDANHPLLYLSKQI